MKRSLIFYILVIGSLGFLMWMILQKGAKLQHASKAESATEIAANTDNLSGKTAPLKLKSEESLLEQFLHNLRHPLSLLLLQIILILLVSRIFALAARALGQQSVIGEIIAGIALGPSLFGLFFPEVSDFIFPKDSLKSLQFFSQIGLALFMFIIGMELDVSKIRNKAQDALLVSHSSIVFPYFLWMTLAYFIYERFAPADVSFLSFALFMGISMSITAFPVLARILQERGMTRSALGALALTCAAADDVTAWCILAMVIAIAKAGSFLSAIFTIVLAIGFVALMLYGLRPWLKRISPHHFEKDKMDKTLVAASFFILLGSAYIAEIIGIHALFGAFIAGVVMPANARFRNALAEKTEDISVMLLLPIFFAFTGLRTQIGLVSSGDLWAICGIVILIAIIGKFGGSALTARFIGWSWKDSLSLGALMNTRGLMELIVLNIGYDLGILSPEIFAIMVIMAIATTLMTGPVLDLIQWFSHKRSLETGEMKNG